MFLIIFTIGMCWAGGQKLYTSLTNRTPAVMSYADYVKAKPSAVWLTLTNCQLDLIHSCYLSYIGDKNAGEQYQYYIPVLDANSETNEVRMLLKTSNPAFLQTIKQMTDLKTPEAAASWVRQNRDRVFPRTTVTGLICFGIDMKDQERTELARTQKNIVEDFVVLDEYAQPSLASGASCSIAGLASLCGLIVYIRKK